MWPLCCCNYEGAKLLLDERWVIDLFISGFEGALGKTEQKTGTYKKTQEISYLVFVIILKTSVNVSC